MITFRTITATEQDSITEPVTLADVKTWANIDHDDDDELLSDMITGARQDIEGETNLKLVANDVVVFGDATKAEVFQTPYGVPTSFVINDIDSDGVETEMDADYFRRSLDTVYLNYVGPFGMTYSVGTVTPMALKEAIKMLVTYRYNNRGEQEKQMGIPDDVRAKFRQYIQVYL